MGTPMQPCFPTKPTPSAFLPFCFALSSLSPHLRLLLAITLRHLYSTSIRISTSLDAAIGRSFPSHSRRSLKLHVFVSSTYCGQVDSSQQFLPLQHLPGLDLQNAETKRPFSVDALRFRGLRRCPR